MARCDYCGTTILFGGPKSGRFHFCSTGCQEKGALHAIAQQVPGGLLEQAVEAAHRGDCPQCGGPGPVDVHTSHRVWSALVLTTWSSHPVVCCRGCAVKNKLVSILFSGTLGWWGIPWGIIATPVQIGRNFVGLFTGPHADTPSEQLRKIVSLSVGSQLAQQMRQQQSSPEEIEEFVGE